MLKSSQHGFRGCRSFQLVIQKERWLLKQARKQDTKIIRVDLDFKNAFNSAGHSSLFKILEGFGVPNVSLLSSIYERSTNLILIVDPGRRKVLRCYSAGHGHGPRLGPVSPSVRSLH